MPSPTTSSHVFGTVMYRRRMSARLNSSSHRSAGVESRSLNRFAAAVTTAENSSGDGVGCSVDAVKPKKMASES